MNTRLMKQWWAWSVAAVIVVAGTIAVWVTPISLELYGKDRIQVECAPLAGGANLVDLWPYWDEAKAWTADGHGTSDYANLKATVGVIERCGVARENRATALNLTAIAGATLLLLTRPRNTRNVTEQDAEVRIAGAAATTESAASAGATYGEPADTEADATRNTAAPEAGGA